MNRIIVLIALILMSPILRAQTNGAVVSSCGSASYSAGQSKSVTIDTTGNVCTNATVTGGGAGITAITPTDRGGTITSGGTAQNAMASNSSRKGGYIINDPASTENLCVSTTTTATTTGAGDDVCLTPGQSYGLNQNGLVNTAAVSVIAATTGHRWEAVETQ